MVESTSPKLDPIFTDEGDDYGPLGNDNGSDVLGLYRDWREGGNCPDRFCRIFCGSGKSAITTETTSTRT